jgi:pimeloyl-ACP methyl ester carboxylesterase
MADFAAETGDARLGSRRLPPALSGALGNLLLRPWFDVVALPGIVRWYFPLSRAWAAATVAGLDVDRFRAELAGVAISERLAAVALQSLAPRQHAYLAEAAAWERMFFGPHEPPAGQLVAAERSRESAAHTFMAARRAFLPQHLRRPFPAVKWMPLTEREVEQRHGDRLHEPARAFPAPPIPAMTLSHRVPSLDGFVRWLRFPVEVAGAPDTAWARVIEPGTAAGSAGTDAPTLIFLHGVGVETEFWKAELGRVDSLASAGIRVVRPEAPFHGRRRRDGWFGGEPVLAYGLLGMLDLFLAWVGEVARLVAWARATSRGPVAVGGVSLGALTSQLVAAVAAQWPAPMRPDALLLVGTTGDVVDAAMTGGLGRALGVAERLASQSWTAASLRRWAPLLEPRAAPVMSPESIVMVIGTSDSVTPFDGGVALARRWNLPEENLFLRRQGHFSVALGLEHDAAPLDRLVGILRRKS